MPPTPRDQLPAIESAHEERLVKVGSSGAVRFSRKGGTRAAGLDPAVRMP